MPKYLDESQKSLRRFAFRRACVEPPSVREYLLGWGTIIILKCFVQILCSIQARKRCISGRLRGFHCAFRHEFYWIYLLGRLSEIDCVLICLLPLFNALNISDVCNCRYRCHSIHGNMLDFLKHAAMNSNLVPPVLPEEDLLKSFVLSRNNNCVNF